MRGGINVGLPHVMIVSHRCVDTCVLFIYCHFSHATHFPHCKQPVIKSLPWHPSQDERPRNGQRHLHIICKNVFLGNVCVCVCAHLHLWLAACVSITWRSLMQISWHLNVFNWLRAVSVTQARRGASCVASVASASNCEYLWDTQSVHSLIKVIIFLMPAPSAFCPAIV